MKDPNPDPEDPPPKKTYVKEKATKRQIHYGESETETNTRQNALLYHTSNETIDAYKQENSSTDLIGRLYNDEYGGNVNLQGNNNAEALEDSSVCEEAASCKSSSKESQTSSSARVSRRGISFDTSSHKLSYTLKLKHPQFRFRRNNKTFMAGFMDDSESLKAIQWLMEELIIHGDTLVVLQVIDEMDSAHIDKEDAQRLLRKFEDLNVRDRRIAIVYEAVVGKPRKLLKEAIEEFAPSMLLVGMHPDVPTGLFSKTTVSQHFLQYAHVPVIVIKPTYQLRPLTRPVDSPEYFHRLLANIDVSQTYEKKKKKKMFSPVPSRLSSTANLKQEEKNQGEGERIRLPHPFTPTTPVSSVIPPTTSVERQPNSQVYTASHIRLPGLRVQNSSAAGANHLSPAAPAKARSPSPRARLARFLHSDT